MIDRIVIVDLETSGLNPYSHGILEIGAKRLVSGEEFTCEVRLDGFYDAGVFPINGITEQIARDQSRPTEAEALDKFLAWLGHEERWVMAGSNPRFDHDFLKISNHVLRPWPFARYLIDLQTAALTHFLASGIAVPNSLSADSIYPLLGMVPEPKPHRAIVGARWEHEAFCRIWNRKSGNYE